MDVTTISALAATGAAVGAFSVAGVQLYVGHRQSEAALKAANAALMNAQSAGRHTVAVFRQSWIDKIIDALSDYHAILMSIGDGHSLSPNDHRKLTALWTRLELLLNPDQADAVSLLKLADAARQSETTAERDSNARDMIQLARNLVKTEWVRIQTELQLPCRHVATHTVDARVIYRRREPLGPLGHLMVGCFDDASGVPDLLR